MITRDHGDSITKESQFFIEIPWYYYLHGHSGIGRVVHGGCELPPSPAVLLSRYTETRRGESPPPQTDRLHRQLSTAISLTSE